jgi:enoyl-CoA hydratase/carnithine racemase
MAEKTRYEMAAALKALRADKSIRALIITGAGDRTFSGGQDLEESKGFTPRKSEKWVRQ